MRIDKVVKILEAIRIIVGRGERFQWCGLTHIAKEAGMNRQTVWRYLQGLEKTGHVEKVQRTWRHETAYRYYITPLGKELMGTVKKLPLESVTNE